MKLRVTFATTAVAILQACTNPVAALEAISQCEGIGGSNTPVLECFDEDYKVFLTVVIENVQVGDTPNQDVEWTCGRGGTTQATVGAWDTQDTNIGHLWLQKGRNLGNVVYEDSGLPVRVHSKWTATSGALDVEFDGGCVTESDGTYRSYGELSVELQDVLFEPDDGTHRAGTIENIALPTAVLANSQSTGETW